ncbi:MAG: PKD domain-containing protein [Calditrichaeota bacterium]|nr:PKD domain-containing protein [Calditrichota bacterium]
MKQWRNIILTSIILFGFLWAQDAKFIKVQKPDRDIPSFIGYKTQMIVVKLQNSVIERMDKRRAAREGLTGVAQLDRLARQFNASAIIQKYPNLKPKTYRGREIDPRQWFKVQFKSKIDPEQAARAYRRVSGVIDAQPIGIHTIQATLPNDPDFSSQWHLNQSNDHDMDAPEAWEIENGNDQIIVALLDTGVRYYHKDLGGANASSSNPEAARGNMWINWAEKNGVDGVDDDGNGFVDDWIGWDFVDGVNGYPGEDDNTPDNDPRDFNGHGTHTAGILAAINNNGYAVASVGGGWQDGTQAETGTGIRVMALRIGYSGMFFIWETGYVSMDFAADAFYYAADNGARLASCSWGSSNSGGLGDAIDYFLAGERLIFKSAGNDDDENTDYMTGRDDIISVAATNSSDQKASFSTYGTWVDISAPGDNIYSTYHNHDDPDNDYVTSLSGTSMAAPNAAAVAALIWSKHPDWTASQVEQRLYDSADNIDDLNSAYVGKLGAGRVNAYNAVNDGGTPPPNASFTADPTSGCSPLTVQFTDQSTGEITDYSWDFGDGGTSTEQNPQHTYNSSGTYTVSLTVTGPGGSDTDTQTDLITVYDPITADFTGDPTSGEAPLSVQFTDQSVGTVNSWQWDFGDGGTSTVQNPTHEYSAAGTYTVTMTASNSCDSDTKTKTDYITVTEATGNPPVADFSGSPTSGDAPLTVTFTDQSTNDPTSWSWDFGDGGTSTEQNPTHTYNSAGNYTVSLTASNTYGSDTETKTDYITVTEATQPKMHVSQVNVTKQSFWVITRGKADIRIVDENGAGVDNATVSGTWSGGVSGTDEVTTDSDGWATSYSSWVFGDADYTFCVDNVSKSGWQYDPDANAETCGSTSGSTAAVEQLTNVNLQEIELNSDIKFSLNSPNPFNPTTTIRYFVPTPARVKIEVYNLLGQRVKTLIDAMASQGLNSVVWDASDDYGQKVSSGFYFYQITYDQKYKVRKKILLVK